MKKKYRNQMHVLIDDRTSTKDEGEIETKQNKS